MRDDHSGADESHERPEAASSVTAAAETPSFLYRQRLRALAELAADAIFRVGPGWDRMLELIDHGAFAEVEEGGTLWTEATIHPDDWARVREALDGSLRDLGPVDIEHRMLRADGTYGWVRSCANPVRDHDGRVVEWIGVVQDISERHEANEALAIAGEREDFRIWIADTLRTLGDPGAIKAAASRELGKRLSAARALYAEIDADTLAIRVDEDFHRSDVPSVVGIYALESFGRFVVEAVTSGQTLKVADVAELPEITVEERAAFDALELASGVAVPLVRSGRTVALLLVAESKPRTWSDTEVAIIEDVAERTWSALERARAEEALRASEEKYRSLFEAIDEAFSIAEIVTDEHGHAVDYRMLEMNPAFERMTGIAREDAVGKTGRELVPDLEPWWIETYAEVALEGRSIRFVNRVEGLDRWFDVYAFPRGGGQFATVFRDITERRKSEQELRDLTETLEARVAKRAREVKEKEERFRRLVEASASTVWTADREGQVQEDSPSWRAYTGQSTEQWLGEGWLEATHPDDYQRARETWERAVETGAVHEVELRLYHAETNAYRWVTTRAVPLRDEQGEIQGWIGMDIDIDERKRAEERVRELASRLAAAEQDERRRIAAVLHDDLQQVLHGVEIKLASVARHLAATDAGGYAREIEEARAWILRGVKTARELTVELSPFILQRENLADVLGWLKRQMRALHGLEVDVDADEPFPVRDEGVRLLLFQVVRELLFNVEKHAGVDRAAVELQAVDGRLVIHVVDEGSGFDVDRIDERSTGEFGFGLFSIRERLGLVGGRLEIASEPGRGTHVTVVTPVRVDG